MEDKREEKNEEKSNLEIIDEGIVGSVQPVTFKELANINEQNQYYICKILKDDKSYGTGFLCIIPFDNILKPLPVLITCNHVLSSEDIKYGKEIKLIIDDKNIKTLIIDESRKIYTSDKDKYDITMIEIKEGDKFNLNKILQIDYDIYSEGNLNDKYQNETIYLIHYPDGQISSLSINFIKKIYSNNIFIEHKCSTKYGSSGAPIIILNTFKVLGKHIGKHKLFDFNCGIILKKPIEDFFEKYNINKEERCIPIKQLSEISDNKTINIKQIKYYDNKKNEIYLKINVHKHEINKKIYYLDNTNYISWHTKKKHFHDFLKELTKY